MITDQKTEKLENSQARLSFTIQKDALQGEYDNLLTKYAKEAVLKGFRKGKVPKNVIERKFGESIKAEAINNSLEESFKTAIEKADLKPLQYSPPELETTIDSIEISQDVPISIKYDVFPEFELGTYSNIEIEEPQVTIGKEAMQKELERYQDQNSLVIDKEDETATENSIVTIDYVELDENDAEIEGEKREDFVFTVGTGYNVYKIDDEITGMKKSETRVIEKEYPEDFENKDLAGTKKKIKVSLKEVKQKDLPEIDDELAQDISDDYETLEDLKKDISKNLKEYAETYKLQEKIKAIIDALVESHVISLPESMIKQDTEESWQRFLAQSRVTEEQMLPILEAQGKSKEDIITEWRPDVEKRLKSHLILEKIAEKEKIEATDEDLETQMQKLADENKMELEQVKQYFDKQNMKQQLSQEVRDNRIYEWLIENAKVKKGKKVKYLDLPKQK